MHRSLRDDLAVVMIVSPSGNSASETIAVTGSSSPGWNYLVHSLYCPFIFTFRHVRVS